MADERGGSSALKGRLADVYVPALVGGALPALSRRLGSRATVDDPLFGRVSTLASIDTLLHDVARRFGAGHATYRHVASVTGVDRDVSEGVVSMTTRGDTAETPVVVVAERRRLREIELRLYYATRSAHRANRLSVLDAHGLTPLPQLVAHVLEALRRGAIERVLAAFEEGARFVDPTGKAYAKRDGAMAEFIAERGGRIDLAPAGGADDGRTCCLEVAITRMHPLDGPEAAVASFERGDSGLLRELRLYYEP